jgi:hypothetical protein
MRPKSKKDRPQEGKPAEKPAEPPVPVCPTCRKTVLHCTCKDNELKK